MKGTKLNQASLEKVQQMFQTIFVIVGLKAQNIPNELEALLLYEHLVKYYGTHTLEEIVIAFELAMTGQLELDVSEVKTYQNFSVMYISNILDYYRMWATEKYLRLEHHIDPPKQKIYELDEKPHWGEVVEKEYQHFLLFGDEHYRTWPEYFYKQLVEDNFIEQKLYHEYILKARTKIISELIALKEIKSLRRFPVEGENVEVTTRSTFDVENNSLKLEKRESVKKYDPTDQRNALIERTRQIVQTEIKAIEKSISELNSGGRDEEIILRAKQYCVLLVFKKAKKINRQHLYQKVAN